VRAQAELAFELINNWGGVAIGEHLGQTFTVIFVAAIATGQVAARPRLDRSSGIVGLIAAMLIAIGLGEGVALAIGADPGPLGLFTVGGYVAFTMWLILTGMSLFLAGQHASQRA
jgi:hypothetical protein